MATGVCKMETTKEVKTDPRKMYDVYKQMHKEFLVIFPQQYLTCHIETGDGPSAGTTRSWTYSFPGSNEVLGLKEEVVEVDDENMKISYNTLEGDVLKMYKKFGFQLQIIPKGQVNEVKWTIVYEKQNESIPDPKDYLDYTAHETEKLDAYLVAKGFSKA